MQVEPDPTHDHILGGQPKPTGQQVAWVFAHLADLCQSDGQSYGYIMQRMFGYPSEEKMIAMGPGQFVCNTINCAISNVDVQREIARCYW